MSGKAIVIGIRTQKGEDYARGERETTETLKQEILQEAPSKKRIKQTENR